MLVNARHVKTVPGRKTDVADATWLAQLGAHGLVKASFVPPEPIRAFLARVHLDLIDRHTGEINKLTARIAGMMERLGRPRRGRRRRARGRDGRPRRGRGMDRLSTRGRRHREHATARPPALLRIRPDRCRLRRRDRAASPRAQVRDGDSVDYSHQWPTAEDRIRKAAQGMVLSALADSLRTEGQETAGDQGSYTLKRNSTTSPSCIT